MKGLWRLLVFGLWATQGLAADTAPKCNVDSISKQCEVLKTNSSTQWIYLPDGTYFRNPEYDNSWWSFVYKIGYTIPRLSQARRQHLVELVEGVRSGMIDRIQNGRTFSTLSAAEKSQVVRLRSVKFSVEQSLADQSTACASGSPNAYFLKSTNQFTICPTALMMPDLALVNTIGHELGHAIGPCTLTFEGQVPGATAVAAADFPQKAEMNCFANEGFQQPVSEEFMLEYAHRTVLQDQGVEPPGTTLFWTAHQPEVEAFIRAMKERPACYNSESSDGSGNSIRETVADMWGARALAEYRTAHNQKDPYEPFTAFAFFVQSLCGPQAAANEIAVGDVHLPSRQRMDRVILANPDLQKILGCQGEQVICDPAALQTGEAPNVDPPPSAR